MANSEDNWLHFEASAYLQTLLGRELFRSDEFAIVELVKNAYDSGASLVRIVIQPPTSKRPAEIRVTDNGSGMSLKDFQRLFMVAGYSERGQQVHRVRVPTGEKGVGRFAADRLGSKLEVVTRAKDDKEALRVFIDWTAFDDRNKRFGDVTAEAKRIPSPSELKPSGTALCISGVRSQWQRSNLVAVRHALEELLDPFHPPESFTIEFIVVGSPALSAEIRPPMLAGTDLEVRFAVQKNGAIRRKWSGESIKREEERATPANTEFVQLAGLTGRFMYFIKRPKRSDVSNLAPGVRLYRDGFRLEPFGHRKADWLGVEEKRAKRAGHAHIVPSRLFGFVSIERHAHPDLRDTTSREALIDTPAARALLTCLRNELVRLEDRIRTEMTEPRWREKQRVQAQELQQARLQALSILSFGLAHELRQPLQVIRSEAQNIDTRLRQLGVVDNDIREAQAAIDTHIKRIDENITLLSQMSTGSLEQEDTLDLAAVVRRHCAWYNTRCAAAGIALDVNVPETYEATVNQATIGIALSNLIINAIEAFADLPDTKERKISVSLMRSGQQHVLRVADSANGIPSELRPLVFKEFATGKTGGLGMGLYSCRLIVEAQGGEMDFSTETGVGTQFVVRLPV
ncbi:MAG: sensor histidine kinase [Thermoanaerobaculia bacterium]